MQQRGRIETIHDRPIARILMAENKMASSNVASCIFQGLIIISKFLKRHSKAKRTRAPAYSRALRRIKGGFSKGGQKKLRSDFHNTRREQVAVKVGVLQVEKVNDQMNRKFVIVNSRFLQRPQKRSRGNQFVHRRLSQTKSIGSWSDPESQTGRQSDGYGEWCLELRRGGRYGPRQQKFRAMNGAHLASPIRGELGYAHWPQLGTQFIALLGTKFGAH